MKALKEFKEFKYQCRHYDSVRNACQNDDNLKTGIRANGCKLCVCPTFYTAPQKVTAPPVFDFNGF